jgi:hypothetical protein
MSKAPKRSWLVAGYFTGVALLFLGVYAMSNPIMEVKYEKSLGSEEAVRDPTHMPLFSIKSNFTLGRLEREDKISAFAYLICPMYFVENSGKPSAPPYLIGHDPDIPFIAIEKKDNTWLLTMGWSFPPEEATERYPVDLEVNTRFVLVDQDGEKYTLGHALCKLDGELEERRLNINQTIRTQGVNYTLTLSTEGKIPHAVYVEVKVFRESRDWRGGLAIVAGMAVLAITRLTQLTERKRDLEARVLIPRSQAFTLLRKESLS